MTQRGRILIVDDDASVVRLLHWILHKEYEVWTAGSGAAALEAIPEFKPQLVLLDVMMPGIDGYETCRQIKFGPLGAFTQVILVSGKATAAERVRGYDALADDYIVKPFDRDELLSKVRAHFRMRHIQNDPETISPRARSTWRCDLVNQMSRVVRERMLTAQNNAP
jgi:DNA-binding response OmpR family regulator